MSGTAPAGPDGTVVVVGTGLIGASVGLGLRARGVDVVLSDASPTVEALARDRGAGRLPPPGGLAALHPSLVVVATPPDVAGHEARRALAAWPAASVTDVASVKAPVVAAVAREAPAAAARFVGGHPMAGRERNGPMHARADLFDGRPWALTPTPGTGEESLRRARSLAAALGAEVVELDPAEHDEVVAVTSHVPQVAASLVAARLLGVGGPAAALSGQGLRDVTRIAAGDPLLWAQILAANAGPVARVLRGLRDDLEGVLAALDTLVADGGGDAVGARAALAHTVAEGNEGRALLPAKHGTRPEVFTTVSVMVLDRPGEVSRLLGEVDAAGVNLEDIRIEHSLGRPTGLVEISVLPDAREGLRSSLREGGWTVVE